jgi:hypothetical protein
MSELETAIDRFNAAMQRLSTAIEATGESKDIAAKVGAESAKLRDELADLRAARKEDAKLREEAADALDSAIAELRGALGE